MKVIDALLYKVKMYSLSNIITAYVDIFLGSFVYNYYWTWSRKDYSSNHLKYLLLMDSSTNSANTMLKAE